MRFGIAITCACIAVAPLAQAAAGDAARGAQVYSSHCGACHSVDADRVGPRHAGVFGRLAGRVEGFDYSPALKASKVMWNAKNLDRWLKDPESLVPGQRMGFRLDDPSLRADVIAYLSTLTAR